ncbi:DUF2628 domain-containing protein [Blastochloris viridis]|uniref:DUF2628 domain-containing protein n=1 Tax=Blastochloris viridis TaxID=1079 RepID=A0A0H5B9T1_BLAVI|nr:DUF2628 domain-containing protein [Blastochloris viridis]ALK11030.1 hypothetical protein BVIR_3274 [Blastochloris viridis]BAR98982.1 hypothetical protein BV133_1389 [Blastochloris viridis]CUU43692.1 hypothetical protein BVIRIDIS_27180 [Blastochloris viridis]
MAIWTVHEPPARGRGWFDQAERIEFVKDGLSWWALLVPLPWMLVRRLWLVAVLYLAAMVALNVALVLLDLPTAAAVLNLASSVIVGLEAANLRRWTLGRRGFRLVAVLSEPSLEAAEHRFFSTTRPLVPRDPAPDQVQAGAIGQPSALGA